MMWEFVDKVIYINLKEREDRCLHMKEIIKTFGDKVSRFEAIKNTNGALGCTQSHIAVLEMAIKENWKNVLILEDDVQWNKFENNYLRLEFLANSFEYDVILLGGTCVYKNPSDKLISAQTTTGYLVNSKYYSKLLSNFKEGYELLQATKTHTLYAVDQYWKPLQSKDNWYIIANPCMVYQRPDYSNIENSFVDYTSSFNI